MDEGDISRRLQEAAKTKILDLSNTRLTYALPEGVKKLTFLRAINLYKNMLEDIPNELFQFSALEDLNLFRNKLRYIPPALSSFTSLRILNLATNQLESLPIQLFQLHSLEELDLSNNSIGLIPTDVNQLTKLRELTLFRNKLKALPGELADLKQLKKLDVCQNQIVNIPARIGELKLQHFTVNENPLRFPPIEVVRRGRQAILDYLKREVTSPVKSIAEGPGLAAGLIGLPSTFTIIARTKEGINRTAGGDNFIVKLTRPDKKPQPIQTSSQSNSTGSRTMTTKQHSSKHIPRPVVSSSSGKLSQHVKKLSATSTSESTEESYDVSDYSLTDDNEDSDTESDIGSKHGGSKKLDGSSTQTDKILVTSPSSNEVTNAPSDGSINATVTDNYDGTYTVNYVLEEAAEFHIEVTLYGEHIEKSPFILKVEPDMRHQFLQLERKLEEEKTKREAAEAEVAKLTVEKNDLEEKVIQLQKEVNALNEERTKLTSKMHSLQLHKESSTNSLTSSTRRYGHHSPAHSNDASLNNSTEMALAGTPPNSGQHTKAEKRRSGKRQKGEDKPSPANASIENSADASSDRDNGRPDAEAESVPSEKKKSNRLSQTIITPVEPRDSGKSGRIPKTQRPSPADPSPSKPAKNISRANSSPSNPGRVENTTTAKPAETVPSGGPAIETKVGTFKDIFKFWFTRSRSNLTNDPSIKSSKKSQAEKSETDNESIAAPVSETKKPKKDKKDRRKSFRDEDISSTPKVQDNDEDSIIEKPSVDIEEQSKPSKKEKKPKAELPEETSGDDIPEKSKRSKKPKNDSLAPVEEAEAPKESFKKPKKKSKSNEGIEEEEEPGKPSKTDSSLIESSQDQQKPSKKSKKDLTRKEKDLSEKEEEE